MKLDLDKCCSTFLDMKCIPRILKIRCKGPSCKKLYVRVLQIIPESTLSKDKLNTDNRSVSSEKNFRIDCRTKIIIKNKIM